MAKENWTDFIFEMANTTVNRAWDRELKTAFDHYFHHFEKKKFDIHFDSYLHWEVAK